MPLHTAAGREGGRVRAQKLGHLDLPGPGGRLEEVHLEGDLVAPVAEGQVHVLAGVVAADDGRGGAAGGCDGHRVIETVANQRPVRRGALS